MRRGIDFTDHEKASSESNSRSFRESPSYTLPATSGYGLGPVAHRELRAALHLMRAKQLTVLHRRWQLSHSV